MNKKIIIFIIIFICIFTLIKKSKIGNFLPALLPAKNYINKKAINYKIPLILPYKFKIEIIASGLGKPRDLAFSKKGTLIASLQDKNLIAVFDKDHINIKGGKIKNIINNLNNPHGLTFYKDKLYVVEENQVVRYIWNEESKTAVKEKVLFALPKGGNHTTRTIVFNKKGQMFVSIGSSCNVCFENNEWLASIIVSDEEGNNPKIWAKGLRNSTFIMINPITDELWATEMGRDMLGDNMPPDEINIIRDNKDYGWPICYSDKIYDINFNKKSSDYCLKTQSPIYNIPAHSAPLGLVFINSRMFPKEWQGDLLVAYHGSWNRSDPSGYKVVHLYVKGDKIIKSEDFITGFMQNGQLIGRPVDLIFDNEGSLFISDDKGGFIYKVSKDELN
ncbi:L-sorbosone dehydrogenase [Candidatus Levyibacteriota bacterium]|nr:PQQ-dependent sugar dehydrogenase [Candidatus Levybacteria bacterium]MSU25702.1 oxidoreductase [Candidatus Levybacteria bacterium]GDX61692.1 L-sorbosone dehydrogenase [Candidatus Levybacteria bacterium]